MSARGWEPDLVPELSVVDLARSLEFWCGLLGFSIRYDRPEDGFAYLERGRAHVMLDQIGRGRTWETAPSETPLGRGINLELQVSDTHPVLERVRAAGWPLFLEPEEQWYRSGDTEVGVVQFLVQDPDGYLVRIQSELGIRPTDAAAVDDVAEVLCLEVELQESTTRVDEKRLRELLAPEFREIGASGKEWDREAILRLLSEESGGRIEVHELSGRRVSADLIQTFWVSVSDGRRARRSSLWCRADGQWQLFFHQGTPLG